MTIFHFPQFERELFWRYFKHLNVFLAQCCYCVSKWKILAIVDEDVNSKTRTLLEYWDFHGKNVDDAWYSLSGLLKIHLNLRGLVVFLDIHFLILAHSILDLIVLLFGMIFVILLTMIW